MHVSTKTCAGVLMYLASFFKYIICLSPVRTALLAIIGFMPTHGGGAIGSLDYKPEERKVLAKR